MCKIVIFGNSGSGKSTLANQLSNKHDIPHLDLDTMAWQNSNPPIRKPIDDVAPDLEKYIQQNPKWVIEGCYADLLQLVISQADEIVFLNPGVDICIENCKNRPWEPHKYPSMKAQNDNLQMLIDWVAQYPNKTDAFSLQAHTDLYEQFKGKKTQYIDNDRNE